MSKNQFKISKLTKASLLMVTMVLTQPVAYSFAEQVSNDIEHVKHAQTDHKAMNELKQRLSLLKTFTGAFEQQVVDAQGEMLQEATGELILKQPNLMLWRVDEPDENLLVADGETLWFMDPFVEQVVASNQADSVANNPIILLTDGTNETWDQFVVTQQDNTFTVSAKDPKTQVTQLTLSFESNTLASLSLTDRQQQISTLVFANVKQNMPISSDVFLFSVPDGYELDDQRDLTKN